MRSWADLVSLGEVGEIVSGATPRTEVAQFWNGDIPWITPADLTGHDGIFFTGKLRTITKAGYNSTSTRLLPARSILFSSRAPIGHCAVTTFPLCTNQGFKSIVPGKRLDSVYGYFALRWTTPEIISRGRGATFLEVTKEIIEEMHIPLPLLAEQRRIAAVLAKADRLRRLRRYALELSAGYLQAVFVEMFGDLTTNPYGWAINELELLADIASGVTKGQKFYGKTTIEVPYLRVANVQDGFLDLSEVKMIQATQNNIEDLRLIKGDIVMTEGGDFDKLGRGAIWNGEIDTCIHQNHIFRVRLDKGCIIPEYFANFLLTPYAKRYFLIASKQTTNLATINMSQLKALPVPVPSVKRQEEFVKVARRYSRLRAQQREALRQAEHLFATLLHRAFRGELGAGDEGIVEALAAAPRGEGEARQGRLELE